MLPTQAPGGYLGASGRGLGAGTGPQGVAVAFAPQGHRLACYTASHTTMASAARAGLRTLHPPRRLGVQVHAGRARSRVKPEAARGAQPQASTERVRISGQRPALDRRSPAGGHHDDGIRRRGGWRVRPARSGFSPPPPAHHGADPRPLGFACESQDVRPPNQASAARSAGTARRRQGLKPEGARRRGRLDAKHESPPPQGRRTGVTSLGCLRCAQQRLPPPQREAAPHGQRAPVAEDRARTGQLCRAAFVDAPHGAAPERHFRHPE